MKVCTLTHTYPRFPGDINAPFVEHLMEHIARAGNDVSVLTAYDPEWNRTAADHTVDLATYRYIWPESLHILGYSRTIEGNIRFRKRVLALSPFLFLGAYRALMRQVKREKPDILHAHWILPNGFIAGMVSSVTGIPLLIQLHGSDVFTAEKNPLFTSMARFAARHARYIVSPSPDLIERLGALGIDTSKIELVPNAVDEGFTQDVTPEAIGALRQSLGIPDDHTVILAMGRMVYVKGFNYLLEAFKTVARDYPKVTLVIAGGGVLYDEMRKLADSLGIGDRVIMPGAVMRDEVPIYFKMAEMFVIPSIRHESGAVDGLPVVVPEAMAAGLPIVGSDLGGIPLLVKCGFNGVLVSERSPAEIAVALSELIDDPELRAKYGRRARRIIVESVNYDSVAAYFSRLYESVANGAATPEAFEVFDRSQA